jgi:hypothetical protein
MALIKEAEARGTLAKREARERVLKAEVESTALLASAHGEADGFARKVTLLEGELTDACQTLDTVEANIQGLSDRAADVNR